MNDSNEQDEKTSQESMRESVMETIAKNNVHMEPRWHFTLRAALVGLGAILVFLAAVYFTSFIVFTLRQTGVWFIPGIGLSAVPTFLKSLPWVLVGVAVVFAVILQILTRRYAFSYGRPFMYSTVAIVVLVAICGTAVGYTGLHGSAFPPDAQLRHTFGQRPSDVTTGTVTAVVDDDHAYLVQDQSGQVFTVDVESGTQVPSSALLPGDVVVVIGDRHAGVIHASGIERFDHHPHE